MKAWTDYPFASLGDEPGQPAPVRLVEVISYDGDKYCCVIICGQTEKVKRGYLYQKLGRLGSVPGVTHEQLSSTGGATIEGTNPRQKGKR